MALTAIAVVQKENAVDHYRQSVFFHFIYVFRELVLLTLQVLTPNAYRYTVAIDYMKINVELVKIDLEN